MRRLACCHEAPQRDEQLAGECHDHGLAGTWASVFRPGPVPPRQATILLEHEESPSQLDQAAADSSVTRSGETFLPAPFTAFVRRTRYASVAGDSSSIPHAPRQDFVH